MRACGVEVAEVDVEEGKAGGEEGVWCVGFGLEAG